MNNDRLNKHIAHYKEAIATDPAEYETDVAERRERAAYYQSWTVQRLVNMDELALYEYVAKLWAMRIWSNKHYVVDQLITKHGLEAVRRALADVVWGQESIEERWDRFRKSVRGMGPAMLSEILCYVHPDECMIWNRRAYAALEYLGVKELPRYDYQSTGRRYVELSNVSKTIASEMERAGIKNVDLLVVDYFFWDELQVVENLSQIYTKPQKQEPGVDTKPTDAITAEFIHDEVRDKLRDIGTWLGFQAQTERKVADGAVVDTVWEATIGNLGRVIYVFEVQTRGSIDSLMMNLLKALNNAAVQGVVAVSDVSQLEKIKKEAAAISGLSQKLKYWDYTQVLNVHTALEEVNEAINGLGLVPNSYF